MFGVHLPTINPYLCFRGISLRMLVFMSLIFSRRLQREMVAIAVAESLRRQLDDSFAIFLWNPYNLTAFALAEMLPNVHVYVLAPEYPPARRAVAIHSNQVILEIQAIEEYRQRLVVRQHDVASSDFKFVFYLSSAKVIESPQFEEFVLLNLFDEVRKHARVPVEVRIHYYDLEFGLPTLLEERLGSFVVRDGNLSLAALSSNQVSFSCQSSIGYELIGLNIPHMIVAPRPGGFREQEMCPSLRSWFDSSSATLPWRIALDQWAPRLAEAYPSIMVWTGKNLLLKDRIIAEW